MNIGKWIVITFLLFTAFIGTLVTICLRQDISLVSKNYYKEELQYQDQIHRLNNTEKLTDKPTLKISGEKMVVMFSDDMHAITGRVKLFCPSDETMDRTFKLHVTDQNGQTFDVHGAKKGMYHVQLTWRTDLNEEYYLDEIIYL